MGQQYSSLQKEATAVLPIKLDPDEFAICPHTKGGGRKFALYVIGLKKGDRTIHLGRARQILVKFSILWKLLVP